MKITHKSLFSCILVIIFSFLEVVIKCSEISQLKTDPSQEHHDVITETETTQEPNVHNLGNTEIHSSFSEEEVTTVKGNVLSSELTFDDSFLKNIPVSSELSESGDAVVFTLVDTAAELRNRAEIQLQDDQTNQTGGQSKSSFETAEEHYIVRAEPKTQVQTVAEEKTEEVNETRPIVESSQKEPTKTAPPHEDIPSFREWSQKQLAEAEKKKVDPNATSERGAKSSGKFRNKNYASPDCGAKIVAANPEAVSSSSVLSSSKDEYMLNYCTSRIWFIVELCEAIQAKQLDLANFELFSSSPKHFAVSISSRFPTRDWSNVGKFTAKDARDVQTFNLNPHLFGKYLKIELQSHYGKEHFCPLSWVGVYGTSEYEVLAKEDDRHAQPDDEDDDDDHDDFAGQRRETPKNLFSSATDAVLSIVKKATAPFMKAENNETQTRNPKTVSSSRTTNCVTPRYIAVCDNCSQNFYDEVYFLLSCRQCVLSALISNQFIRRTLIDSESCGKFGLDFNSLRVGAPFPYNVMKDPKKTANYLSALLKDSYIAALCNALAVNENKVVVNASADAFHALKNLTDAKQSCDTPLILPSPTCSVNCQSSVLKTEYTKNSFLSEVLKPSEQITEKIEPTKTLTEDEVKKLPSETVDVAEISSVVPTVTVTPIEQIEEPKEEPKVKFVDKVVKELEEEVLVMRVEEEVMPQDQTLDSILSDISELQKAADSSSSTLPPPTNLPTESIFLRLANRIKNLEINMSLSSSYLEEMSRRYRNQLEVLSKTVNATAQRVEEQYKLEVEREKRREKEMSVIRMQLANLTRDVTILLKEKNSWKPRASLIGQHFILVTIEVLIGWIVFSLWKKTTPDVKKNPSRSEPVTRKNKRRNSLEGALKNPLKVRRPSDEALEIALAGNYNLKKRKRKKKESKASVSVIHFKRKKSEHSNTSSDDHKSNLNAGETDRIEEVEIEEVESANRFAPISSPKITGNGAANEPLRRFSSPVFMKTAISSRNSRIRTIQTERESSQESSASNKCDRESTSDDKPLKEKKGTGFKKYMKKFF